VCSSDLIDPGHGGTQAEGNQRCGSYNVGTSGYLSGNEKDSVLVIGQDLKAILEIYGAIVSISRTSDTAVCLGERASAANNWGADVFVSIHHNGNDDSAVNGVSAHWYKSNDLALAEKMVPRIIEYTGLNTWGSTGVRYDNFQVLRDTNMPATLLELGFMTNPGDDAFIAEYEHKLDFINGIIKGLHDYFL
jgi:N-acetylmuramoyl-L-alanine amidase